MHDNYSVNMEMVSNLQGEEMNRKCVPTENTVMLSSTKPDKRILWSEGKQALFCKKEMVTQIQA